MQEIKGPERDYKLMKDGKHGFELQLNRDGRLLAPGYTTLEFE